MARILIVEDETHIARVMSLWLGRHGHDVVMAANGLTALELLNAESVDLIITDMNMPGLDGLGLITRVREQLRLTVPILLLSARCDRDNLTEKLQPYHVQLFPKPFVPSRLVADIERALQPVAT